MAKKPSVIETFYMAWVIENLAKKDSETFDRLAKDLRTNLESHKDVELRHSFIGNRLAVQNQERVRLTLAVSFEIRKRQLKGIKFAYTYFPDGKSIAHFFHHRHHHYFKAVYVGCFFLSLKNTTNN